MRKQIFGNGFFADKLVEIEWLYDDYLKIRAYTVYTNGQMVFRYNVQEKEDPADIREKIILGVSVGCIKI